MHAVWLRMYNIYTSSELSAEIAHSQPVYRRTRSVCQTVDAQRGHWTCVGSTRHMVAQNSPFTSGYPDELMNNFYAKKAIMKVEKKAERREIACLPRLQKCLGGFAWTLEVRTRLLVVRVWTFVRLMAIAK